MSKWILALAATLSLAAATPALAQDDEDYASYPYALSYHPFRLQIEGGHTITEGSQDHYLDNGLNLGLGFTWQPLSRLPLAFRVDGMYEKRPLRAGHRSADGELWRSCWCRSCLSTSMRRESFAPPRLANHWPLASRMPWVALYWAAPTAFSFLSPGLRPADMPT